MPKYGCSSAVLINKSTCNAVYLAFRPRASIRRGPCSRAARMYRRTCRSLRPKSRPMFCCCCPAHRSCRFSKTTILITSARFARSVDIVRNTRNKCRSELRMPKCCPNCGRRPQRESARVCVECADQPDLIEESPGDASMRNQQRALQTLLETSERVLQASLATQYPCGPSSI